MTAANDNKTRARGTASASGSRLKRRSSQTAAALVFVVGMRRTDSKQTFDVNLARYDDLWRRTAAAKRATGNDDRSACVRTLR